MALQSIPPIQCLLTFEAVARTRSVSRAADELCVTVSAVSHRLRQLEVHMGFKLFERNDFSLSADGAAYLAHVRAGLQALRQSPLHEAVRKQTRLRVAVTPTFARQLLMPKLELFRNAYPEIELTLQVSIPLLDVTAESQDLEVRFGTGSYGDREVRLLQSDDMFPACSPSYLNEAGPFAQFETEREWDQARLVRSPLEKWSPWFNGCGVMTRPEPVSGSQFNDLGLAYDAAASGFGVVLLRTQLGAAWLDSGRLVRLSPRAVASPHRHFICWKTGALERWECAAFVDWLERVLK